jgi:endoglucanase
MIASSRSPPNTICATLSQILGGIALLGMLSSAIAVAPLSVSGNKILASGKPASFSGSSLFWSNVNWGGERFYNANTVSWLKNDWKSTIVRAAMGVEERGGFLQDPAFNKAKVKAVVDAAIANDMYVIIGWHSHKAENHCSAAIAFFEEMARTYGHHPNIIYEIYNEPLEVSWSGTIKPYAEAVVGAIRAIDPDNLIIVGTPNWSQNVDEASLDPITRYPNIAYTLHIMQAPTRNGCATKRKPHSIETLPCLSPSGAQLMPMVTVELM